MAFKKKEESRAVSLAKLRLAGMRLIDTNKGRTINYGDEDKAITQNELDVRLHAYATQLEEYNQLLSRADQKSNELEQTEEQIKEMYSSVLKSGTAKFGADSSEVEQLGGTRKSDRQAPVRKNKQEQPAE